MKSLLSLQLFVLINLVRQNVEVMLTSLRFSVNYHENDVGRLSITFQTRAVELAGC